MSTSSPDNCLSGLFIVYHILIPGQVPALGPRPRAHVAPQVLKTSIGCVAREETRNNVQPQAHFAMISVHVIDRAMPEPERELGALLEHLSFAPHDKEQTEDIPG
jgi:hypothetical protein